MINTTPVTVSRQSTREEREFALIQIYNQVLERQPFESEREALAKLEKDFLRDKIGVRRFLKEFACSDLYLDTFYFPYPNTKFLEICFKHFLGRAIANHDEMRYYDRILTSLGVKKAIHAILDSEEFRKTFGCFTVPYARPKGVYESPKAFLETQWLGEEHICQQRHTTPSLYWHSQIQVPDGPTPHPEANEELEPRPATSQPGQASVDELSVEDLLATLRNASPAKAREMVASLSPQQRQVLRQAIH